MSGFNIFEVPVNFEIGDPSRYYGCLKLNEKEKIDYWVFFRGEFAPQEVLEQLSGKKINISTEPIKREDVQKMYLTHNREFFIEHFKQFDYFTHYDCTEIPTLKTAGFNIDSEFMLPVDTETYQPMDLKKVWDVIMLGRMTARRVLLTMPIRKDYEVLCVDNGMWGEEAVRAYNMSRIGMNLNISDFRQNQNRLQTMMACGLPIISDEPTHLNWLREDDKIYFEFLKAPDSRVIYSLVEDMLTDTTVPLKTRGKIMRRIAVNQFDAATNWKQLIEKVDQKGGTKNGYY